MIRKITILFFTGFILLINTSFQAKQQKDVNEYSLKAAFIYRFTDYVEWQDVTNDAFTIAVLGESEIVPPLTELAKNKKIRTKKINIKQYENINDIQGGLNSPQVIFVSQNYSAGIENVIAKAGELPVLIIGEQRGNGEKGAVINFILSNNKLKFEINMKAVYRSGLKVSSQLLQHAILVNTP